jgi:hypothetical protein
VPVPRPREGDYNRHMPPPSKLTPEVVRSLETSLADGLTRRAACARAGIGKCRIYVWEATARAQREAGRVTAHTKFLDRIERAEAGAMMVALTAIREGRPNWEFYARWLEIRWPLEFGRRRRQMPGPEVRYEVLPMPPRDRAHAREDQ